VSRAIRHDEQRSRFELVDAAGDEVLAFADYLPVEAGVWEFHHTVTHPAHRGQGLAAEIVTAALDDVRARGGRVVPTCWYVEGFIRDHPEYEDLRAEGERERVLGGAER